MIRRRKFITGVVTAGTVVVAGCTGGGDVSTNNEQEAVVEQYFTGIHDRDVDAVNEVLHPDADVYPIDEETISQLDYYDPENVDTVEITGFDGMTVRELAEWATLENATEEEIEDDIERLNEKRDSTLDEPEVDDHTFVVMSVKIEERDREFVFEVVQDYADNYVWI